MQAWPAIAAAAKAAGSYVAANAGTIAAVAGAGLSAYSMYQTGQQQSAAAKLAAEQETLAARDKEIERRRALIRSLSSRAAEAGASGLTTSSGSQAALALSDIGTAGRDRLAENATSAARKNALNTDARYARRIGTTRAMSSLLDAGSDLYKARG